MSIIWCGGEDNDFTGLATFYTSRYRTSFSRGSMGNWGFSMHKINDVSILPIWVSSNINYYTNSGLYSCFACGIVNDVSINKGIWVGMSSNNVVKLSLYKFDGTTKTVLATEPNGSLINNTNQKLDIHIDSYGVNSTVNVYCETQLIITYTGDITIPDVSLLNAIGVGGTNGNNSGVSEIIVADEDTRLMSLKTLAPNAAGDVSGFTGTYTAIDDIWIDDIDVIYTAVPDTESQFNLTGMPTGDFICKGVAVKYRATDGIGGIGLQAGIRTNTTTVLGSTQILGGVWENKEILYQQNPVTSNRFTPAEIEALQVAFKTVAV